jgi:hypothetical protein
MKRYILLLAIFASACSTHTTAPVTTTKTHDTTTTPTDTITPPPVVPHPFPSTFQTLTLSFKNIPENWSSSDHKWDNQNNPPLDTTIYNSGHSVISGIQSFPFEPNSFSRSRNSINAPGVTIILDTVNGIIDSLYFTQAISGNQFVNTGYIVECEKVQYTSDTANQIVVKISGSSLQLGLVTFSVDSWNNTNSYLTGEDLENNSTYSGIVSDSASLTIRFIP